LAQVLLGLADVLVDDRREVYAVNVRLEDGGEDFGGERLARPRRAVEERAHAAVDRVAEASAEVGEQALAVAATPLQLGQLRRGRVVDDDLAPVAADFEPLRERVELLPVERAAGELHVGRG